MFRRIHRFIFKVGLALLGWWAALSPWVRGSVAPAGDEARASSDAGDADAWIHRARIAESQFDPAEALRCYLQAERARPDDPVILRGLSKAYSDSTLGTEDAGEKRRRIEQALACAKRACALEPHNAVNQLSLAVCYGKLGLYADVRDRVEYARLVKSYAEQAVALDPDYAYAHHVLGQWNYEVASLGRAKRFLVGLIFGGLPPASTAEAVRQLECAVRLSPRTISHRLALGYAYLADGQPRRAQPCFEAVLTMPKGELYDDDCRRQAQATLATLRADAGTAGHAGMADGQ